ncbi:threonine/serine ThrE exporter family protein [Capnocytophaga catalasegens]|uniref:Membrane protein n=1 Tax=Capnocytophaga catalasegens TaxID=1004260 RepID=A0AAV5AZN4_9FLAO|nr:threonine/serine exporter family protein [Capnocytophaga catalasegens]GIZ15418.1 membrane protein [Capnocytophaga catalasegens]GJM51006.1 membrane protein [Capnocytophaga catalasegens]GJM52191.1 membrane protein [Capnocytophaga catalasegens]
MLISKKNLERTTHLLADISALLIGSGSNTRRALRNVERIANALGYHSEIFHSYSGVILTVYDKTTQEKETLVLTIPHHGVNFNAISAISILSWQAIEQKLSIDDIEKEVAFIKKQPHYNMVLMWFFTAIAGGSLAYIFGGNNGSYIEFGISFLATFAGISARKLLQIKHFNHFICWAWAAFVSVSVVNIFRMLEVEPINNALAACVLWLVPGVPLINGFIDLLTGHVVSGWAKISTTGILVFMIAIGFYLSLILFGYELL